MTQPPFEIEDDPFRLLPDLLALAANANVSVKLSALPTLARQPYPYADLWPHIHRIIHAFGAERVMWGSDWTRVVPEHTYRQQADYIRTSSELGPAEKRLVLGAAARRILRWPRG
jgi:L-fuconolactonase